MLRDNHAPARASGGFVQWSMAAGPDTVTVEIAGDVLCALGAHSATVLETFERHRDELCAIAAAKWSKAADEPRQMLISARDVVGLLGSVPEPGTLPERTVKA